MSTIPIKCKDVRSLCRCVPAGVMLPPARMAFLVAILSFLHNGRNPSIRELAQKCGTSVTGAVEFLKRLESAGLIERSPALVGTIVPKYRLEMWT